MSHHRPFELSAPVDAQDHVLGPPDAPVTLVEYGDFECPYCKQAAPAIKILLARFERRVRFVFRHFPIEQSHPHALQAAKASECAAAEGKFWQMHDMLFANQLRLQKHHLRDYARQLSLDVERFDSGMLDGMHLARVRVHQRTGIESGVRSTPAFFINGRIHDASYSLQSLGHAIGAASEMSRPHRD